MCLQKYIYFQLLWYSPVLRLMLLRDVYCFLTCYSGFDNQKHILNCHRNIAVGADIFRIMGFQCNVLAVQNFLNDGQIQDNSHYFVQGQSINYHNFRQNRN